MPLTVDPAALTVAAAVLAGYGSSLATGTARAASLTIVIPPAGADSVSIQQAAIFSAFGTQLQAILGQGQDYQSRYETNLGAASDTYSFTESANAAQTAADPAGGNIIDGISELLGGPVGSANGEPFSLSSNAANIADIGFGNWASAGSDLIGLAGGGLLDTSGSAAGDAGAAAAADLAVSTTPASPGIAGMGGAGLIQMAAGAGQATMVGKLSVPPSWAGAAAPGVGAAAASPQTVGWTASAPQGGAGTIVPGLPGMASAARNPAALSAPRYGVKPIVMPKPAIA